MLKRFEIGEIARVSIGSGYVIIRGMLAKVTGWDTVGGEFPDNANGARIRVLEGLYAGKEFNYTTLTRLSPLEQLALQAEGEEDET